MEAKFLPSLVVDDDSVLISEVQSQSQQTGLPAMIAQDPKQAEQWVKDPLQRFSGIFINPEVSLGRSVSLIRSIRSHHPAVPIFLMYEGKDSPFSAAELRRMAIHGAFRKPIGFDQMVGALEPMELPQSGTKFTPREATLINGMPPPDTEFVAVPVEEFLSSSASFFDVYVRLDSGRYLKVLRSGTSFSQDRIQNYMAKGLQYLYIKRSAHERCLGYCNVLENTLPLTEGVSESIKIAHVLSQGEVLLKYIRDKKALEESDIEEVIDFTVDVHELVRRMNLKDPQVLDALMKSTLAHEHAVGTTILALLTAKQLGMKSSQVIDTVGVAAFLHDIGLYDLPEALHTEDESKMTPEQIALYRTHPEKGASKLSQLENIPATVVQAVLQHHERRDGKGFPRGKVKDGIHRVAEIVGISAECTNLLQKERIRSADALMERMEEHSFRGFTFPMVEAFTGVFGKKPARFA